MPTLKKDPKEAKKHKLATSAPLDTLETIAQKNGVQGGWEDLALYWFGTKLPNEVNRALSETIGVAKVDDANASKTELKAMTGHSGEVPVPEDWTGKDYEATKRYRLTITRSLAPTAVSITSLDKWFIPGKEECELKYALEGSADCADKLDMEVFGSNYCDCTEWKNGLGKYSALPDEPVYTRAMRGPFVEERVKKTVPEWKGQATAKKGMLAHQTDISKKKLLNVAFSPYTVVLRYYKDEADNKARLVVQPFWVEWEETPTKPAVTPEVAPSAIKLKWTNAAKADAGVVRILDKNGLLVHLAEIPEEQLKDGAKEVSWDRKYRPDALNSDFKAEYLDDSAVSAPKTPQNAPYTYEVTTIVRKPKTDALKVKWEIKDTTRLTAGQLLITDRKGKLVFQKPLEKKAVAQGGKDADHEFAWDGAYTAGVKNSKDGDKVIPEDMPYRVQVQAHTGPGEPNGIGLAAMHTEVRLYVHPKNKAPKDLLYDSWNAKPSLALGLAPIVPGDAPEEGDGTKWIRYQLAQGGFHPGPITDKAAADAEYKNALKEFKRSVPADGSVGSPNFTRLAMDGANAEAENDATKTAINTLRAGDKRKWFGDLNQILANSDNPDVEYPTEDEAKITTINTKLRDPNQDLVVWVDDRQYYTAGDAKDDDNKGFLTVTSPATVAPPFGLENYRGAMDIADNRTNTDSASIARPWIPLQVDLRLLSREKELTDEVDPVVTDKNDLELMRGTIGPLRVDWTFEDLPPDYTVINAGAYDKKFTRSRRYVWWTMQQNRGTHTRKDTKRAASYNNCKTDLGGIRPDGLDTYYQEAFGTGDLHLAPWGATAVSDTESVATVVHEHLLKDQKEDKELFAPRIGQAGVYFHPSRTAGDGYRVRAELNFEKFTDYEFPNLEQLKARYPAPPQAHTARLRLWRRSSVRGYMFWAAANPGHWPGLLNGMRAHYRAAHLYFVHEGGTAARQFNVTDVFDAGTPTHVTRFKKTIKNNVHASLGDEAKMTLKADHVWPWADQNDFGWPWKSAVDLPDGEVYDKFLMSPIMDYTWRSYRIGLLLALARQVERLGVMRGHLFVEFDSSPAFRIQRYKCDGTPQHTYWILAKGGVSNRLAQGPCPAPGCNKPPGPNPGTLRPENAYFNYNSMPMPAVGGAMGATWLFTSSDADTWAHEVGHHRHLEHAASAPGAHYDPDSNGQNTDLHDSVDNTTQPWAGPRAAKTAEQDWDRNCVMSYAAVYYPGGQDYFCGKCLLRNRGWKVATLGYPPSEMTEP